MKDPWFVEICDYLLNNDNLDEKELKFVEKWREKYRKTGSQHPLVIQNVRNMFETLKVVTRPSSSSSIINLHHHQSLSSSSSSSSKKSLSLSEKPPSPEGFSEFWAEYPRSIGKAQTMKRFKNKVKRSEQAQLMQAVGNYKLHISRQKTELQYIKHASTFLTNWKDWLDESLELTNADAEPSFTIVQDIDDL